MSFSFNKKYWNKKHILILLLLGLLCYWPFTFGIFSAKNDNITQFLPVRFQVSEALRNGHLPLWSPYMYLGYPIHGDMQGGAWNPTVWLLSLFGRYTVASLHWEILIYVLLSALGMYRLLGAIRLTNETKLIGAAAYMMCGYITDSAGNNAPFLAAAPYIPFALAYSYHLLQKPCLSFAIKCAIALWLLLVSAYPSFFIVTAYILIVALTVIVAKNAISKNYNYIKQLLIYQTAMAAVFLLLSAPAIISYVHVLPFYARVNGVSLAQALENSFHPSCSLSFLLPLAPTKNSASFSTDPISRNAYFNIFLFLFALQNFIVKKNGTLQYFILSGLVFSFLFSLGPYTPIRTWCYQWLPLMNTFRHPSNARLFVIMGGVVTAMMYYEKRNFPLLRLHNSALLLGSTVLIIAFLIYSLPHLSFFQLTVSNANNDIRNKLKAVFETLTFHDLLFINCLLQLLFIGAYFFLIKERKKSYLPALFIFNSLLFAQLIIPYTLVSRVSPKAANKFLKAVPKGYPTPDKNKTIAENSADTSLLALIGIKSFYNKDIGTSENVFTPTYMTLVDRSMKDSAVKKIVFSNSYAYFARSIIGNKSLHNSNEKGVILLPEKTILNSSFDTTASFVLKKMWNNGFVFQTQSYNQELLCLQQLFLDGWYCSIGNQKVRIYKANGGVMAVSVPPGKHEVKFLYQPKGIIISFWISITTLIFILWFSVKKTKHEKA